MEEPKTVSIDVLAKPVDDDANSKQVRFQK